MNDKLSRLGRSRCESIDVIWFTPNDNSSDHVHRNVEPLPSESSRPSPTKDSKTFEATLAVQDVRYFSVSSDTKDVKFPSTSTDPDSDVGFEDFEEEPVLTKDVGQVIEFRNSRVGSTLGGIIIKVLKSKPRSFGKYSHKFDTCSDVFDNHRNTTVFEQNDTILIDKALLVESLQNIDTAQKESNLSIENNLDRLDNVENLSDDLITSLCCCVLAPESNDLDLSKNYISSMDRGKDQTSISYERRLAERTASRISKPETVRKQVAFKTEMDKQAGSVKRASPKQNEEHHGEEEGGKKIKKINEPAIHSQSSGLTCPAPTTSMKKTAAARTETGHTASSRRRLELRQMNAAETEAGHYTTPLKKSQMEVNELKIELSKLTQEIDDKNVEIASLQASLQTSSDENDKQIEELKAKLSESETQVEGERNRVLYLQEELNKVDERITALKVEFAEKEDKFEAYLMNMYKKGLEAARFEREEELEMLAKSNKSNVTVRELTRKLSRTESELAKWQGLRLEESYFNSERPRSESDATLCFVRDSFLHFMGDSSDIHEHLKALLKIFKYSDDQLGKIWKGLETFKNIDRKKIMDKVESVNGNHHGKSSP